MNGLVGFFLRQLRAHAKPQLAAGNNELRVNVAPLAHAHVGEVLPLAQLAQLILAQCLPLGFVVAPQGEPGEKIRLRMLKTGVSLIGLGLLVGGSFPRILNRHGTDNYQHFGQTARLTGRQQHAAESRVYRQPRQLATQRREPAPRRHRTQLLEQAIAIADHFGVGGIDKGKPRHVPQPQLEHAQHDGGEIGAPDLGIGEFRAALKIGLAIEPQAHPLGHTTTATHALVGAGSGDWLNGQALQAAAHAVATDACLAGVNHVANARHGERGLGHVGGEHYPHAGATAGKYPILLGLTQARVEG